MRYGSGEAVKAPDRDGIKTPAVGVSHKAVKLPDVYCERQQFLYGLNSSHFQSAARDHCLDLPFLLSELILLSTSCGT